MSDAGHLVAVRLAYDAVAADYADLLRDELGSHPVDRAVLAAFADQVHDHHDRGDAGLVADVGCGPGRVAAHLDALGLDVVGIDLSPAMVARAGRDHPHLRVVLGSIDALPFDAGALAGAVAWCSIIHAPPAHRPRIFHELRRVLRPGGHLLVAFQVGDEHVHLDHAYGHDVALDVWRLDPDVVTAELVAAGFEPTDRTSREPAGRERQPQAFLLLRAADIVGP